MRLSYNYANRTIDMSMFTAPEGGEGLVKLKLEKPGKIVTGKQKLAQRFIILMLTAQTSVFINSEQGTLVGDFLAGYEMPRKSVLQSYFILAIKGVRNIITRDQDDTVPDDEYLIDASMDSFDVSSGGNIFCGVELETRDGETYIVPITLGSFS